MATIKAGDILVTPGILLASLKVKVAVRFVPMMEITMVRLLNVSKPTMVATSMEEDIVLHPILLVVAVATLSAIAILDDPASEVVPTIPIIIMFRKEMATLPTRPVVIVVMTFRNLFLKNIETMITPMNLMFSLTIIIILMKKRWIFRRSIMSITDC